MLVISRRKSVAKLKKCISILGEYKEFSANNRSKVFEGNLVSWLQKFRIINLESRTGKKHIAQILANEKNALHTVLCGEGSFSLI